MKKIILICLVGVCCLHLWPQNSPKETLRIERKNSVYAQNFIFFPSVYYDRIIPLHDKVGISARIGFSIVNPILGGSLYFGNEKHIVEAGAIVLALQATSIGVNYRFIGSKGLVCKIGYEYLIGELGTPIIALGYAF